MQHSVKVKRDSPQCSSSEIFTCTATRWSVPSEGRLLLLLAYTKRASVRSALFTDAIMKTYTKNDAVATDGAQLGKDTRSRPCIERERERERERETAAQRTQVMCCS